MAVTNAGSHLEAAPSPSFIIYMELSSTSPAAPPATELKRVRVAADRGKHQHGCDSASAPARVAAESSVSSSSSAAAGRGSRHRHGSARAAAQSSVAGPVSSTSLAAPPATELKLAKTAAAAARGRHQRRSSGSTWTAESSAAESERAIPIALLDAYEIEWIKRKLERLIAGGERSERMADAVAVAAAAEEEDRRRKTAGGGFWVRHVAGVCGPNGGVAVAEAATVGRRGLRRLLQ